ncbi:hypothetical protein J4771_00870 [Candidatus Kaistella beijingensis]|uniref:hypothetical protein n=1 Tax=Candidatus Kaistella beijingensis TaxID=2820270 RepID=UPI001CC381FB|nr:hypothetical protein [Candidatus Kaistella beijingensis]UBB89935.1 hypothetical protein J4771_00870 [Candidatus Kaistella beijingensis]
MRNLILCLLLCTVTIPMFSQTSCTACEKLLQNGLYKTFHFENSSNFENDFKTYLESDQFKKDIEKNKWELGIDVVIDGLPLNLTGNSDNEQVNEFQNKIRSGTTLKLKENFYNNSFSSIPDVELASIYSDCVAKNCGYGFNLTVNPSEKDAYFLINYKPLSGSYDMPKVIKLIIKGAKNIKASFNENDFLQLQNSVSVDREEGQDIIFLLTTDKGTIPYRIPANPSGFNKDFPVGTIITSYLSWDEFQKVTQNNLNNPDGDKWNSKFSKWAPCDGRAITSDAGIARATENLTNMPDLRGVFLRGLNIFDDREYRNGVSPVSQSQKDPENRIRGVIQEDAFKKHNHGGGAHIHNIHGETGSAGGKGSIHTGDNRSSTQWDGNPNFGNSGEIINSEGDKETRPKNIAVYYYIRIN